MKPEHTFEYNRGLIIKWAEQRDLLHAGNSLAQMKKVFEEVGELKDAIEFANNNPDAPRYETEPDIIDGIGDSLVTLIILSEQLGYDPVFCLEQAYAEIKNRKGKTINGTFVKEKDAVSEFKFKKGDRVVVVELDEYLGIQIGDTGVVLQDNDKVPYVRMDRHDAELHDAGGLCELGHGWAFSEHQLELEK